VRADPSASRPSIVSVGPLTASRPRLCGPVCHDVLAQSRQLGVERGAYFLCGHVVLLSLELRAGLLVGEQQPQRRGVVVLVRRHVAAFAAAQAVEQFELEMVVALAERDQPGLCEATILALGLVDPAEADIGALRRGGHVRGLCQACQELLAPVLGRTEAPPAHRGAVVVMGHPATLPMERRAAAAGANRTIAMFPLCTETALRCQGHLTHMVCCGIAALPLCP